MNKFETSNHVAISSSGNLSNRIYSKLTEVLIMLKFDVGLTPFFVENQSVITGLLFICQTIMSSKMGFVQNCAVVLFSAILSKA